MTVQKYQFHLSKLSLQQVQLEQAVFSLVGTRELASILQTSCEQHLHLRPHFQLESWRSETLTEAVSKLADTSILLSLLPQKRQCPFFVEFDVATARRLIEQTLGGREVAEPSFAALTDIEQGVLQYLVLHLLADLLEASGEHKNFQLQRMITHHRDLHAVLKDDDTLVVLMFRMQERNVSHFIRCFFPQRLLAEELAQQKIPAFHSALSKTDVQHYPFVQTELWAEAGESTLSFAEFAQLEPGDVVLFDQVSVGFHAGKAQGEVTLKVGCGQHASLLGKVQASKAGFFKVTLEQQVGEKL